MALQLASVRVRACVCAHVCVRMLCAVRLVRACVVALQLASVRVRACVRVRMLYAVRLVRACVVALQLASACACVRACALYV